MKSAPTEQQLKADTSTAGVKWRRTKEEAEGGVDSCPRGGGGGGGPPPPPPAAAASCRRISTRCNKVSVKNGNDFVTAKRSSH